MYVLNVAQKPSVASSAVRLLTDDYSFSQTHSKYNPVYNFAFRSQKMLFTSVSGHVLQLSFQNKERYNSWHKFQPQELLGQAKIEIVVPQNNKPIVSNLQNCARMSKQLNLWLDCDREGEAIAFQVIDICLKANPRLKIFRAKFSAVTKVDVLRAFDTLQRPDSLLSDSIDYRIGCALTVFQTVTLQQFHCIQFKSKPISYGPCQIPTLGFVTFRDLQIRNFVPQDFYQIIAVYKKNTGESIEFKAMCGRVYDVLVAELLYLTCFRDGQSSCRITKSENKQIKKYKPRPMSTLDLQKIGSQKLRMSANRIMQIAQKLYQKGFISYPRTQTTKFPATIDLKALLDKQREGPWASYLERLLNGNFQAPRSGDKDDQAHPPIHPVQSLKKQNCTDQQYKVFELIVRHFLACCSKDALGEQKNISAQIGSQPFFAKGVSIKQLNYLQVYPYQKWFQNFIPEVKCGDVMPCQVNLHKGRTTPPLHLNQAELLALMDKHGIGTDATMTDHIQTIQKRGFAVKTNSRFVPTKLGISLVMAYQSINLELAKPRLRAQMQQLMRKVSQGQKDRQSALQETLRKMEQVLLRLIDNKQNFAEHFKSLQEQ